MLRTRIRAWLARTIGATGTPIRVVVPDRLPDPPIDTLDGELNPETLTQLLSSMALFSPLTKDQVLELIARSSQAEFPAEHTIIRQEAPLGTVYALLTGHVRVFESMPDSSMEMFLGELGPGEIFGELAILRERPRAATVVTLERTRCLLIPAAQFLHLVGESKEMALALLRILAARLFDADRLLARHAPDPLTGLPGRRAFHEMYRRLTAGAKRRGTTVLLLVLDVLHLKEINDQFGYSVGDDVLRIVADALLQSCRSTDLVTRYGGDEFTLLLVEASAKDAQNIIDRVQRKLRDLTASRNLPVTIECRIGYAFSDDPPETSDEFLRIADEQMQGKSSAPTK